MAGMPMQSPDPWSQGINAAAGIASKALDPTNTSQQYSGSSVFDNSGFVVNIGAGTATSTKTALPTPGQAVAGVAAGVGSLLQNPAFIIIAGVGLYLFLKHK